MSGQSDTGKVKLIRKGSGPRAVHSLQFTYEELYVGDPDRDRKRSRFGVQLHSVSEMAADNRFDKPSIWEFSRS